MEKEEFEKKMAAMKKPEIKSNEHQVQLKLTLLNAKRSARIGLLFVLAPCVFLFFIFLKYILKLEVPIFTGFEDWMADRNHHPIIKLLVPLLLIGTPLVAFVLNAFAVLHFELNRQNKELLITVKLKLFNIIILVISAGILLCFLLYAAGENF